jgi:small subunit ribosomal protein S16
LVKIRLKRMGATKRPFYRLVVADSRSPRDGRFIDEIGVYDPLASPSRVEVDADKVRDWMRKGARPSDTARKLLEQQGILPKTARPSAPPRPAKASTDNGTPAATAVVEAEAPASAADEPSAAADSEAKTDVEAEVAGGTVAGDEEVQGG